MAVNVKMGVDLSSFNSGIREGQGILKGLNAEMKATEAEFKATGDAEKALESKTKTLNSQLNVQRGIAQQAQQALKAMEEAGIKPTDQAYQKLYATMMNAQAGMNEAQAALNGLSASEQTAAKNADGLVTSVNAIGKKISLEQVINGIGKITDGLENAAQKAVQLGEKIWNSVMDSAAWSDDVGTLADRMGLSTDQVQKMKVVADEFEAPVESLAKTWKKVKNNMSSDSKEVIAAFDKLGIKTKETSTKVLDVFGNDKSSYNARNYLDVFWDIGDALMKMENESKREQLAQKLLGRSWDEMIPLFKRGRQAYEEALDSVTAADDEAIQNNEALQASVSALEQQFEIFKAETLGKISPELTKVTDSVGGLLSAVTEYAKSPEGQEMLSGIGDAISGLVDDIAKIDPEAVVSGFTSVIDGLVGGLRWIIEHKDELVTALEVVVAGWAGLKITGGLLTIVQLVNGLKGLGITGAGAAAGGATGLGVSNAGIAITGGLSTVLPGLTNWLSVNGGPVADWFTHNSTIGHWLMGTETPEDTLEGIKQNVSTVVEDWKNNVLFRGVLQALTGGFAFGTGGEDGFDENEEMIRQDIERMLNEVPFDFTAEPVVSEDAAESIASQIGTVAVPGVVHITGITGGGTMGLTAGGMPKGGGGGLPAHYVKDAIGHANGLPWVPYDGYLAALHRGERVLTASENRQYTYNSNNYFGNVNLNNGQDIETLCNSIDRHNRRRSSGYGS